MATVTAQEAKINIGRVVQRGFQSLARHAISFLVLAVVLVGIPTFLTEYLTSDIAAAGDLSAFRQPQTWLVLLFTILLSSLLQGAVVHAVITDLRGSQTSIAGSLAAALKMILPMLGITILSSIIMGLGLILLIVPGIIAYIMLIVSVPVLMEEKLGVIGSMKRSRELTKGSRGKIFTLLVIFGVVFFVSAVPFGLLTTSTASLSSMQIINTVFGTVVGLLSAVFLASLYVELRMIKEGGSVQELAAIFE